MAEKVRCCRIGRLGLRCGRAAQAEIIALTGHPEDTSLSCERHIGQLLGSVTQLPWGSFGFEIHILEGASW